jgi:hypothetical protein
MLLGGKGGCKAPKMPPFRDSSLLIPVLGGKWVCKKIQKAQKMPPIRGSLEV